MRSVLFSTLCSFAFLTAPLLAQEGGAPLKITTRLHDDGTRSVTTLDADRRSSEEVTYDSADKIRQRVVYSLDEQNLPASGVVYDAKGKAVFKSTYKYDTTNRVSEQTDYTAAGKLIRRLVFEYGGNNRVSRIRSYDANGVEIPGVKSAAAQKSRR